MPEVHPEGVVRMGLLLHLGSLEDEFYASSECLRVYTRWDALALLYAVFLNFTLLRALRPHLLNPALWHLTVQFALYFVTAAAQLLLLWRHPQRHQRHRMRIIAAHRLVRLAFTGLVATANRQQHAPTVQGTLTSSSGGTFLHCSLTRLPELHDLLQQACNAIGTVMHWGSLLWRGSATPALAAGEVGVWSAPAQQHTCG
ncbi:hypothetical protein OEZ86_013046 [Tetradesmus obliquus]|nr:hypothetical protein OEZ86_013046 [Tetradesmus obliquus]